MKLLFTIMLSLTVGLATSCKTSKSYVEVDVAHGWGLLCGGHNEDSCKVVYVWHKRKIIHSHYMPMNTPDSLIKRDSLAGVRMLKLKNQ